MGSQRAFTLVEALVVVAIIAVLTGIMIPVIGEARESARASKCASNMRQLGMGLLSYANQNRGRLPGLQAPIWDVAALSAMGMTSYSEILKCPSDDVARPATYAATPRSYSMNPVLINYTGSYVSLGANSAANEGMLMINVGTPPRTALLIECHKNINIYNNGNWVVSAGFSAVHGNSMNVVFCDGSVRAIKFSDSVDFNAKYLRNW